MTKQIPLGLKTFGGPFTGLLFAGTSVFGVLSSEPAQKRQISSVAQRIRVGGDAAFASEAFDTAVIEGFENGQDLDILTDGENRSYYQNGQIASYVKGIITLASQWSSSDASVTATARNIVELNNGNKYVCVAVGTKLRAYNITTPGWSDKGTFASNAIHLHATDKYLYISCGTGDAFWRWDGTTFTQPKAGQKFNCMWTYKGVLYGALGNQYYSSSDNGAKWSKASDGVGWANTTIDDLYESQGVLVMAKPEGLFVFDGGNPPTNVYPTPQLATSSNFVGGVDFMGTAYLPLMATLHTGLSTFKSISGDIMPSMVGTVGRERWGHGFPKVVVAGPSAVYIATDDGEGVYPEVLRYNGIGFEQIYRGTSGDTMRAAGYSRLLGQLIINDGATRVKDLLNAGTGEYPNYASSGTIEAPAIDGGYPDENKAFRDVTLELEGCTSTETVTVKYYLDDGSLTTVDTITSNGKVTVLLGGADGVIEGKKLRLHFALARGADTTLSPKIKGKITVRLIVTPKGNDARTVPLIVDLSQPLFNGYGKLGDKYSSVTMQVTTLEYLRERTGPISYLDEFGRLDVVKITDLSDVQTRVFGEESKHTVALSMTDMLPALKQQIVSTALITSMTATAV